MAGLLPRFLVGVFSDWLMKIVSTEFDRGGVYILLIKLELGRRIKIGKLGTLHFEKGIYLYVGSASRGIQKRVERYLKRRKRLYWHIDYFLRYGEPLATFYILTSESDAECRIANSLAKRFKSIPNFGSSDCRCKSHLFYETLEEGI